VDVRFSSEQVALRDSVAQVVERLGAKAVGQLDDTERVAKLDAAVIASGWRELRTADDAGAPWASAVEVAIVAEELAKGVADAAFVGPTLAAELRRLTGTEPSSAAETVALTADLEALGSSVAVDAAGATGVLAVCDGALVEATLGAQLPETDLTRPSFEVGADVVAVELPAEAVTRITTLGLAVTCADLVGTMQGGLDLATDYAKDRHQYGAAIGSFQAVQHMLADAHVLTEGSRSVMLHAAWAVDALSPEEALAAAAGAKAYCARSARAVCETVIQVHGGIGNTWECMAHVFLRRALLSSDILGGVGPNLEKVLAHHGIGSSDGLR
jgi:alkylation response protein AidB-like acyl-CoA dehydrogenase